MSWTKDSRDPVFRDLSWFPDRSRLLRDKGQWLLDTPKSAMSAILRIQKIYICNTKKYKNGLKLEKEFAFCEKWFWICPKRHGKIKLLKPNLIKELSLCNKIKYLNLNIFRTRCCKPLIFQILIIWFNRIHSLKYLRSTTFCSKDIVIRKSGFVAKTQFLSCTSSVMFSSAKSGQEV